MQFSSSGLKIPKIGIIILFLLSLFISQKYSNLNVSHKKISRFPTISTTHKISGCINVGEWLSVEEYCTKSGYIEYNFFSGDLVEAWVLTKSNYELFEQGVSISSSIAFFIYRGIGVSGRFYPPESDVWVFVIINIDNSRICLLEEFCEVIFHRGVVEEPFDDDDPPSEHGEPLPDIKTILLISSITLIICVFLVGIIVGKKRLLREKTLTNKRIQRHISRILKIKGGKLIRTKKFFGIEWISPNIEFLQEFKPLELPENYSNKVFEKAYCFSRDGKSVIRLKIHGHLNLK